MSAEQPTILATCGGMVGGDLLDTLYGPLLHEAIRLARVPSDRRPRVLHIDTALGDQRLAEATALAAARAAGADAIQLRFSPRPNVPSLREAVLGADVVWVSGGSVVNLLAIWRAHGFDAVLRAAWEAGVVLAGSSAGALCWHAGGVTQSHGLQPEVFDDGLGFVPTSLGVHTDSNPLRSPVLRDAVATGALPAGIEVDEGVGVVYRGLDPDLASVEALSEVDGGRAVRIETDGVGGVSARPLPVRRLPDAPAPLLGWAPRPEEAVGARRYGRGHGLAR